MSVHTFTQLAARASSQHGVFSRSDARDLDVPRSTLSSAVRQGRFSMLAPGVYVLAGSPDTVMQRIAVAVLSMPALAAVSHTAAELWGMTHRGIRNIHLVTTRWDRAERPGVTVHEWLDLLPDDVTIQDGIPLTSAARTIVDLGATSKWVVERALEQGIRRDMVAPQDIERIVARVGRRGRRSVGVIRPLLEQRRRWDHATESALEDLFREAIAQPGLPQPVSQFELRDEGGRFVCRADFAHPTSRVLIELDSEAHHIDRLTFRSDRSK